MNISVKEFAKITDRSDRAIRGWIQDGMPVTKEGRSVKIDIVEGLLWQLMNTPSSPFRDALNSMTEDIEDMSVEDQLRVKRMEKLELETEIIKGKYVEVDEVDNITAQMNALLISQYRQHLLVLPNLLAKKNQTQIKKALDETFKNNVDELRKLYESGDLSVSET